MMLAVQRIALTTVCLIYISVALWGNEAFYTKRWTKARLTFCFTNVTGLTKNPIWAYVRSIRIVCHNMIIPLGNTNDWTNYRIWYWQTSNVRCTRTGALIRVESTFRVRFPSGNERKTLVHSGICIPFDETRPGAVNNYY